MNESGNIFLNAYSFKYFAMSHNQSMSDSEIELVLLLTIHKLNRRTFNLYIINKVNQAERLCCVGRAVHATIFQSCIMVVSTNHMPRKRVASQPVRILLLRCRAGIGRSISCGRLDL